MLVVRTIPNAPHQSLPPITGQPMKQQLLISFFGAGVSSAGYRAPDDDGGGF